MARKPVSVLVTGTGGGVGQSILKALRLSNVPLKVMAADSDPLAAGLYTADVSYVVPKYDNSSYISRVKSICKKEGVDLVFVGTDVELEVLSRNAKEIKTVGAHVVVSPLSAIRIADDKWKTVQFLKRNNFLHPRSCLVKDLPDF